MATKIITIPQEFINSVNALTETIKKYSEQIDAHKLLTQQHQQLQTSQSIYQILTTRFSHMVRMFTKIEQAFARSISWITSVMGTFGRMFMRASIMLGSTLLPIIGTMVSATV